MIFKSRNMLLALILFSVPLVNASHIVNTSNFDSYLITSTEEEMLTELKSLLRFKNLNAVGATQVSNVEISIRCTDDRRAALEVGGSCFSLINNLVPAKFSNLLNRDLAVDGPNCWNASLVALGLKDYIEYTDDTEFNQIIEDECRPVNLKQNMETGDIIAIRNFEGEVHAMVHISPNLVFSKNGYEAKYPYVISKPRPVYNTYGVFSKECEFQIEGQEEEICLQEAWANVYRCH